MTGRTHALTGVGGGCLLAGALPVAWPARGLVVALVVVGSLAPDIDHAKATLHSTRMITTVTVGAVLLPLMVRPSAYRRMCAVLVRVLLSVLEPVASGANRLAVRSGRAVFRATATRYDKDDWNDGHRILTHTGIAAVIAGLAMGGITTAVGLGVATASPGLGAGIAGAWWWCGLAFGWGCLVHILGDSCTVQGTPIAWPLTIRGKRWYMVRAPDRKSVV